MEQSRLKLRISRMFRASFGSCRTRNISDVMEKAVFAPPPVEVESGRRRSFQFPAIDQTPLMSPRARPFPSICKPRCPESAEPIINHSCIRVSKEVIRRRKVCVSDRVAGGRLCPPVSPNSHFEDLHDFYSVTHKKKSKRKKRAKAKTRPCRSYSTIKREAFPFEFGSKDSYSVRNSWWFSSDDETDTLFSSRSLSSASSESLGRRDIGSSGRRTRPETKKERESEVGVKMAAGRVKDSFAVVKRSSDPYSDFRSSMVEMIVEKQIFGTKDLENMLQCFLSLNSHHHHKMILEAFTEIWEALFCNWC